MIQTIVRIDSRNQESSADFNQAIHVTEARKILSRLVALKDRESLIGDKKANLHRLHIETLLDLGASIFELKKYCRENGLYGQYLKLLSEAEIAYSDSDRKMKAFLLFGSYRDAVWLQRFGISALERLATIYFAKGKQFGIDLLVKAISLAQQGNDIGIAWVNQQLAASQHNENDAIEVLEAKLDSNRLAGLSPEQMKAIDNLISKTAEHKQKRSNRRISPDLRNTIHLALTHFTDAQLIHLITELMSESVCPSPPDSHLSSQ